MTSALTADGGTIHFPVLDGTDPSGPIPPVSMAELETIAHAVAPNALMHFSQQLIAATRKRAEEPRWAAVNSQRLTLARLCLDRLLNGAFLG